MANPNPTPPPLDPGQQWYQSSAFLVWAITTIIGIAGGIATLVGHPFDSTSVTAIATAVAWAVPGIITTVFVHGQQKLAQQKMVLVHQSNQAALERAHAERLIGAQGGPALAATLAATGPVDKPLV